MSRNMESVEVGQGVIAIGNALGYGQSVTNGIISALGRTVTVQDEQTGETVVNNNMIQTNAAINPGNSGGVFECKRRETFTQRWLPLRGLKK